MSLAAAGALVLAAILCGAGSGPRERLVGLRADPRPGRLAFAVSAARSALAHGQASPGPLVAGAAALCGTLAALGGGPVAGGVVAAYAGLAVLAWLRRQRSRAQRRDLVAALDGIAAVASDVRAGVTPAAALGAAMPSLIGAPAGSANASAVDLDARLDHTPRGRLLTRFAAACRLAEESGAPLADVLERLDSDARAAERARVMAAAHAASARATAVLLAALPLAGIGLGHAIGADPLTVLLRTPAGAACAFGAVALQAAGLAWTGRLARIDPEQLEITEEWR